MFKTQRIREDQREVKQIKKILPYTVSDIGGKEELKAWKAEQVQKQADWDAGRDARYAEAKGRAVGVITGADKARENVNLKADKAFAELENKNPGTQINRSKPTEVETKSLFSKILNKFLDIKYE